MSERKYPPNERLRQARELRGWGQKDLAEKLGVPDERSIRRWEVGDAIPTPYYRQRLCAVFEMDARELGILDPPPARAESPLPAVPQEKERPSAPPPQDKNRQRLLQKVARTWIRDVLEHSLQEAVLIHLDLEERPEALANPWELAVQQPELPARPLPPDTTIQAVYDQAQGEVLILGEPGAGKTTLLLALARSLLERAGLDESHPMPVVFHLSSWAVQRLPLEQWLVEELHDKYQVPRALGKTWLGADQILPLLDGLDEVDPASRTACIEALNAYIPEHTVPLVVCSRLVEYFAQTARLSLTTAVFIQPLTARQIDGYLEQLGARVATIRSMIQHDGVLQELMQTPLMLSIFVLASQGQPVKELLAAASVDSQRRQLFTLYVEQMLRRRGPSARYTPEQTEHWLTWLARRMQEHRQSVFYLESIQPDWLPAGWTPQFYHSVMLRFWAGLIVGLLYGARVGLTIAIETTVFLGLLLWLIITLACTLVGGLVIGPGAFLFEWMLRKWLPPLVSRILSGVLSGLVGGLISGWCVLQGFNLFFPPLGYPFQPTFGQALVLIYAPLVLCNAIIGLVGVFERRPTAPVSSWSWRNVGKTLLEALLIGLVGSIGVQALLQALFLGVEQSTFALFLPRSGQAFFQENYNLPLDTLLLLLNIAAYALPVVLLTRRIEQAIQPAEVVSWSWRRASQGMIFGIVLGLVLGPVISLFLLGSPHSPAYKEAFTVYAALLGGFFGGLFGGLSGGVSKTILEERTRVRPNQLIWRSARNALRAGATAALVWSGFLVLISVGTVVYFQFFDELVNDVLFSLLVGTVLGALVGGVWVGGLACLQHLLLRFLLWRTKRAPWGYPRFLDYATERILLQRVGGGYLFIHRLLLDYFAGLENSAATQREGPPPLP